MATPSKFGPQSTLKPTNAVQARTVHPATPPAQTMFGRPSNLGGGSVRASQFKPVSSLAGITSQMPGKSILGQDGPTKDGPNGPKKGNEAGICKLCYYLLTQKYDLQTIVNELQLWGKWYGWTRVGQVAATKYLQYPLKIETEEEQGQFLQCYQQLTEAWIAIDEESVKHYASNSALGYETEMGGGGRDAVFERNVAQAGGSVLAVPQQQIMSGFGQSQRQRTSNLLSPSSAQQPRQSQMKSNAASQLRSSSKFPTSPSGLNNVGFQASPSGLNNGGFQASPSGLNNGGFQASPSGLNTNGLASNSKFPGQSGLNNGGFQTSPSGLNTNGLASNSKFPGAGGSKFPGAG